MQTKLCPLLLLLFAINSALAQQQETLLGNGRIEGGFGGPFFTFSQSAGQSGFGAGGGGGAIINDFFIGGFGQGESFGQRRYNSREYDLSMGFGGLWMGYVYPSHKVVHLFASAKVGWGGIELVRREDHSTTAPRDYRDNVFVFVPELGAEFNLLHWFRTAFAVGYRTVSGIDNLPTIRGNDFNSTTFAITLRFGGFGYAK